MQDAHEHALTLALAEGVLKKGPNDIVALAQISPALLDEWMAEIEARRAETLRALALFDRAIGQLREAQYATSYLKAA